MAVGGFEDFRAGEECLDRGLSTVRHLERRDVGDGLALTPRTAVGKNEAVRSVNVVVILLLRAP